MTAERYLATLRSPDVSSLTIDGANPSGKASIPYQSGDDYERLQRARIDIERALRKTPRFQRPDRLVLATRETTELNAHATYFPQSDEYLIVFNRGLLMSIPVMANLVVHALERQAGGADFRPVPLAVPIGHRSWSAVDVPEELLSAISDASLNRIKIGRAASRFVQALDAAARGFGPGQELAESLPRGIGQLDEEEDLILDAALDFVFGHEYAHVVCGHVRDSVNGIGEAAPQGEWGPEYQADTEGLDLLGTAWAERFHHSPVAPVYIVRGVTLFFSVLRHIERYRAYVLGDRSMIWRSTHSHPPTTIRWMRMITQLEQRVPGVGWPKFVWSERADIEGCLDGYFDTVQRPEMRTAVSDEFEFQERLLESMGKFFTRPQDLLLALTIVKNGPDLRAVSYPQIVRCMRSVDEDLTAHNIDPIRTVSENTLRFCDHVLRIAECLVGSVGEANASGMIERACEVIRHDALCRYGPIARAKGRKPIKHDTEVVHADRKPDTIRLLCPRCDSPMYLDMRVFTMRDTEPAQVRCGRCLSVSECRDGTLHLVWSRLFLDVVSDVWTVAGRYVQGCLNRIAAWTRR